MSYTSLCSLVESYQIQDQMVVVYTCILPKIGQCTCQYMVLDFCGSKFTILTQLPSAVHSPISPQTSLLSLLISRTYDLKIGMNNPCQLVDLKVFLVNFQDFFFSLCTSSYLLPLSIFLLQPGFIFAQLNFTLSISSLLIYILQFLHRVPLNASCKFPFSHLDMSLLTAYQVLILALLDCCPCPVPISHILASIRSSI